MCRLTQRSLASPGQTKREQNDGEERERERAVGKGKSQSLLSHCEVSHSQVLTGEVKACDLHVVAYL